MKVDPAGNRLTSKSIGAVSQYSFVTDPAGNGLTSKDIGAVSQYSFVTDPAGNGLTSKNIGAVSQYSFVTHSSDSLDKPVTVPAVYDVVSSKNFK